ncbi:MAG: tRNA glutamyl-Q(34) synthetase GluQRS [Magnetococcales bacterium]|nr:tRNA glutamyl-Q(34) synthetase GluQRS [Magnetococcales bacterium]MBF0346806.1 tRNA glutamyl-Q(34) synthetase GluQRS [Magnetococcales bacterium]MBF0630950.1 tRNA glutamyl-Q(34) synthetase GluQRS [Magnetococcales bacterium]
MSRVTTRFAPSPTGLLHPGHARSAILSHDFALRHGGRFIVRIEDIDQGRCRPEFEQALLEDLSWLGLTWTTPIRRQSECMADYAAALAILEGKGLLYPCFCTRRDIQAQIAASGAAPHGPEALIYPGTCRNLDPALRRDRMAQGVMFALRLDMTRAMAMMGTLSWFDAETGWITADAVGMGDVVLARKEMPVSYHLAVTVDDHLQGVTHVIRGADLFAATHVHRMLQALLGLNTPCYWHHPLVTDARGQRLAKRNGAVSLRQLRQQGVDPETVRRQVDSGMIQGKRGERLMFPDHHHTCLPR